MLRSDPDDPTPESLRQRPRRRRRTAKHVIALLKGGGTVVVEMVEGHPVAKVEGDTAPLTANVWNTVKPALVPAGDGLFEGTSQTYRHPEARS